MARAKVRFDEADREVYDLMESVIQERFPGLTTDGGELDRPLKITILMASNGGEVFKPCLKHHGSPATALIKKSRKEERACDGPDVYIEIDANRWAERREKGRMGILAHELYHIELQRESPKKGGGLKYDAYDRPVITLIPDEINITGFYEVAQWYGEDSAEYQSIRAVHGQMVQLGLPFPAEEADAVEQGGHVAEPADHDEEPATIPARRRGRSPKKDDAAVAAAV